MSKHRVLSLEPHLRLEWRGQDGHNETEQPKHSASLSDSITSSTRIRFSVHTGGRRRCGRRAKLQHHNEPLHPDRAEAQQPHEVGTRGLAERIVTAIKACTGCLRHPRADCGATRRPAADYRAATGDFKSLHLSRSALGSRVAEHFHLRDTRTVKPHAGCLFMASLRTADGQWECPAIGADRKSLADGQNGALDPISDSLARAGSCKTRSAA